MNYRIRQQDSEEASALAQAAATLCQHAHTRGVELHATLQRLQSAARDTPEEETTSVFV